MLSFSFFIYFFFLLSFFLFVFSEKPFWDENKVCMYVCMCVCMYRRVAEVFEGVFVLTGIFIKGVIKYECRRRELLGGLGACPF